MGTSLSIKKGTSPARRTHTQFFFWYIRKDREIQPPHWNSNEELHMPLITAQKLLLHPDEYVVGRNSRNNPLWNVFWTISISNHSVVIIIARKVEPPRAVYPRDRLSSGFLKKKTGEVKKWKVFFFSPEFILLGSKRPWLFILQCFLIYSQRESGKHL